MADEMHDPKKCNIPEDRLAIKRGIEVGHIFNFKDKYSKAMNSMVLDRNGEKIYPQMGSYGVGVSRVVAATIETDGATVEIPHFINGAAKHTAIRGVIHGDGGVIAASESEPGDANMLRSRLDFDETTQGN